MAIRSAAKAIILDGNRVLVNKCASRAGDVYYSLPGGGQRLYEELEQAVAREVFEETGYRVRVLRFAALAEEIYDDADIRREYPDYTHRIFHLFTAEIIGGAAVEPSEMDTEQQSSEWLDLATADALPFAPKILTGRISEIARGEHPIYLGSIHYE